MIGGNVVKLVSSTAGTLGTVGGGLAGGKILMKNSNLMQVGKMTTNAAGKPAFVITNKQGQQIRPAQQIIFVTTAGGQAIRTVPVSTCGFLWIGLSASVATAFSCLFIAYIWSLELDYLIRMLTAADVA